MEIVKFGQECLLLKYVGKQCAKKKIKLVIKGNYFILGKKHEPLLHFFIELPDGIGKHVGE